MKYCPKNKSHKNPKDAVFCSECGARLIEVVDNKVCLHCGAVNPTSAMFCKDCGAKLSDDKGYIELTVCSSEQCERILAVGTTSYQNNTSKCVLKVPAQKRVDVLLQCNGKAFRATADLTQTTTLHVNWGTIEIHCDNACQIRLEGNSMDTPLVKTALTGHETIKVPHGKYKLRVELDGEVEEKNLDVRGPVAFKSLLQRKKLVKPRPGTKTCPVCHAENPKDAEFCHACGHSLVVKPKPKPQPKPQPASQPTPTPPPTSTSSSSSDNDSSGCIIAIIIFVILAMIFG